MENHNSPLEEIKGNLDIYWDLLSPIFPKSLTVFETIKNKELVKEILEQQTTINESIIYASLILSPEIYNVLWENNIKNMPIKRIHQLTHSFTATDAQKLHTVPCHILMNEALTMEKITSFLEIRDKISTNSTLVSVLEDETWLDELSTEHNKSFAELIMSEEKRVELWNNAITSKYMSPERMHTIEKRLGVEEIKILWEWITHKNMTVDKIILIGEMLSVDDLLKIWAENLAKMSISELQTAIFS